MLYEFRVAVGKTIKAIKNTRHLPGLCTSNSKNAVKKWFAKFRCSDFYLDQLRSGRPSGIDDDIVRNLVQGTNFNRRDY